MRKPLTKAEIKELVAVDPDGVIDALIESPELLDRLHPGHKTAKALWDAAHRIDADSLKEQRGQARPMTPKSVIVLRREIEARPEFTNRTHPLHSESHKAWLDTFNETE